MQDAQTIVAASGERAQSWLEHLALARWAAVAAVRHPRLHVAARCHHDDRHWSTVLTNHVLWAAAAVTPGRAHV